MNKKQADWFWGWIIVLLVLVVVFPLFNKNGGKTIVMRDYNEFWRMLNQGKFTEVEILKNDDGTITVTAKEKLAEKPTGKEVKKENAENQTAASEKKYIITTLDDPQLISELKSKPGVKYETRRESKWFATLLDWIVPVALFFLLWSYLMKRMGGGVGGGAMSFGKSRAKLLQETGRRVTFEDVAGVEEAKEELKETIDFLKDPGKFQRLGGRIPKGVLLVGPPGAGKTLLARAVAGEAGVPFFSISGSDFVEMFVGVGASRVRDLFVQGQKSAPCIIFIDELDAVGRHRGAGLGGGHDEREQTLNQLLVEMDGFDTKGGVIILAATNRPDILDPALLRPGRFDRRVVISHPDVKGREAILGVHIRRVPLAPDVDLSILARGTPGFSGADLENLVNEAALLATRNNKSAVDMNDFELAKDKVMMGAERRSIIISEKEKRAVAYHEAGHALVAKFLPEADPVHKVTIIPRGMALGLTQQLPLDEKHMRSKEYLLTQLAILFGGRAAEKLKFGPEKITTGASNDIEHATEIVHKMICEWGMSDALGLQTFGQKRGEVFLGRDFTQTQDYSEDTARKIDSEVGRILKESFERAEKILSDNLELLNKAAEKLLERETMNGAEFDALILESPRT